MRSTRKGWMKGAAGVAALTLTLSACGGGSSGGSDDPGSGDASGGGEDAIIRTNGSEPQNPLIPAKTVETGGGKVVAAIFSQLIKYDEDGAAVNDIAESIESDDQQNWTITIKEGRKFADGTDVTAKSFVDAWNWAAHGENNNLAAFFFEPIEGYDDVHPAEEDVEPSGEEMSGLEVVDDTTFTVKLKYPYTAFPQRLGYTAFSPLPESFYDDPAAFGENPVGNGPYKFESWDHNSVIKVVKNDQYSGDFEAENGGVDFNIYQKPDAAYVDLRDGKLDVLDTIPETQLSTFTADLGDRAVNQPAGVFQSFTFPMYVDAPYAGMDENAKKVRKALSMAIDRDTITEKIFNGTRTPAEDFSSPVVDGYSEDICGEACDFEPDKAKQLLEEAGGWDGSTLTIAYNSDGGHESWVDAVCGSINNTLGIECKGKAYPDFKGLREDVTAKSMEGSFRTGWQMDYPALENFLTPLYKTGASSNDGDYTNEEFDSLLEEGDQAADHDAATEKYQAAEKVLLEDMPTVPLWYSNTTGGYGQDVDNVTFDVFGVPIFHEITKS